MPPYCAREEAVCGGCAHFRLHYIKNRLLLPSHRLRALCLSPKQKAHPERHLPQLDAEIIKKRCAFGGTALCFTGS